MNSSYYALPDYNSLIALASTLLGVATKTSNNVFSVGYSYIDFWVDVTLAGGSPINSVEVSYGAVPHGISPITISANDDLYRTDSNTIVAGAYTSSIYLGTTAIAAGHHRFLYSVPTAGWATYLKLVFNSADAGSTVAVYANRRL